MQEEHRYFISYYMDKSFHNKEIIHKTIETIEDIKQIELSLSENSCNAKIVYYRMF